MRELRESVPPNEQAAEIARFVVRTTVEAVGRGPTRARAYLHDEVLTAVLTETLTRSEQRLLALGQGDAVHRLRRAVQATIRDPLAAGVEKVTGRKVRSVHIDHQISPDVMTLVFVFGER